MAIAAFFKALVQPERGFFFFSLSFFSCLVLGGEEQFIGATKVSCGRAYRAYHQHEERREKKQVATAKKQQKIKNIFAPRLVGGVSTLRTRGTMCLCPSEIPNSFLVTSQVNQNFSWSKKL